MDSSNKDTQLTDTQLAEVIRSMIQHEDKLRNHRVTWALIVQGFFIGVAGDLWKTGDNKFTIIIIAFVAIILLFSFKSTVNKNDEAITRLVKIWRRNKPVELELENIPITGCGFELNKEHSKNKNWNDKLNDKLLIWKCLPFLLIMSWSIIILILFDSL